MGTHRMLYAWDPFRPESLRTLSLVQAGSNDFHSPVPMSWSPLYTGTRGRMQARRARCVTERQKAIASHGQDVLKPGLEASVRADWARCCNTSSTPGRSWPKHMHKTHLSLFAPSWGEEKKKSQMPAPARPETEVNIAQMMLAWKSW